MLKYLIPVLVALAVVTLARPLLDLLAHQPGSASSIDGFVGVTRITLASTVIGFLVAFFARVFYLRSFQSTHGLKLPKCIAKSIWAGFLGAGAAGGSIAAVVTFLRGMIDYVQLNGPAATASLESVVYMGLVPVILAIMAFVYSVQEAVLKPPETDN